MNHPKQIAMSGRRLKLVSVTITRERRGAMLRPPPKHAGGYQTVLVASARLRRQRTPGSQVIVTGSET
jgi:hypothetical protein